MSLSAWAFKKDSDKHTVFYIIYLLATFLRCRISLSRDNELHRLRMENLILRQQLSVLLPKKKKQNHLSKLSKLFWIMIKKCTCDWKSSLVIVKPDTVIKWHRDVFKLFWKIKSKNKGGRPRIDRRVITLIKRMARENPLWGAPRIHGELTFLGIDISEASVSRYMPRRSPIDQKQSWKTFISNHFTDIVAIDFFVIPTLSFKFLYGFLAIRLNTREVIHINVTKNPSQFWAMQQIRNISMNHEVLMILRDNDSIYGREFRRLLKSYQIEDLRTTFKSPKQNAYCERCIGSIRRELLDHVVIYSESQARRLLVEYKDYYNTNRTHLGLKKETPVKRKRCYRGEIDSKRVCASLHGFYTRKNKEQIIGGNVLAS